VLDPKHGFGGDGRGRKRCIRDGPFAGYTNSLGPGYENTRHCIDRQVTDVVSRGSSQANVNACLAKATFAEAWPCIENQPHLGGHGGVGGQVSLTFSSVNLLSF
jgi:tyrosinase